MSHLGSSVGCEGHQSRRPVPRARKRRLRPRPKNRSWRKNTRSSRRTGQPCLSLAAPFSGTGPGSLGCLHGHHGSASLPRPDAPPHPRCPPSWSGHSPRAPGAVPGRWDSGSPGSAHRLPAPSSSASRLRYPCRRTVRAQGTCQPGHGHADPSCARSTSRTIDQGADAWRSDAHRHPAGMPTAFGPRLRTTGGNTDSATPYSRLPIRSPRADLVPATGPHLELPDVSPMRPRRCAVCREPLPPKARIDMVTCGPACRTRRYRNGRAARDAFVTPSGSMAARSAMGSSNEPVGHLGDALGAQNDRGQLALWSAGLVRP